MFDTYREVLSIHGTARFSAAGLVARLPIAMVSLGIVLLLSDRTGSYGFAGVVSAFYVIANALAALPLARAVDTLGQRVVLGPAMTVSITSLAVLVLLAEAGARAPWLHLVAMLAGATMPNVGAAVRARWAYALTGRGTVRTDLDTAFALEAVNDEMVFILGPTIATLLAAALHPAAGVITGCVAGALGTWQLLRARTWEPPVQEAPSAGQPRPGRTPMPWRSLAPLILGGACLGIVFGSVEVATVAFSDERSSRAVAGVLLALWAGGSLLAGLLTGTLRFTKHPAARFRWGLTGLAVGLAPLPFISDPALLGLVLFACGFAISPTLIAAVAWVETLVPLSRLNEGLALFTTALVAGIAPGAAAVGGLIDARGASASFWLPWCVALLGAGAAWARIRHEPRSRLPDQEHTAA